MTDRVEHMERNKEEERENPTERKNGLNLFRSNKVASERLAQRNIFSRPRQKDREVRLYP